MTIQIQLYICDSIYLICTYVCTFKNEAFINLYFANKRSQQVVLDCLVKGTELLGIPFKKNISIVVPLAPLAQGS